MTIAESEPDQPRQPNSGSHALQRSLAWGLVILVLVVTPWGLYHMWGAPYRRAVAAIEQAGGQVVTMDSKDGARVRLGGEQITDADLVHLAVIPNVEFLFLGGSKVTDGGLTEHVSGLASLHSLRLNNTNIGDAGLDGLQGLDSLAELYLSDTAVTDKGLRAVAGMVDLTLLDLTGTAVGDAGLAELRSLKKLKILRLEGTQVTDHGLELLKNFPDLEVIILSNTKISDAGLEYLKRLPKLNLVRMHDTQVTDAGEAALRKALPNCRIDR